MYHFNSTWQIGAPLASFSQSEIKNEPMLFSCDAEAALRLGGPLTTEFMRALPVSWRAAPDLIIDSRVHMLMGNGETGWYSCIPGWHHDDIPRPNGGQPDYDEPEYLSEHVMALFNGDICPTDFAIGEIDLPKVDPALGPIYGQWHPMIEKAIEEGRLERVSSPSNRLVFFDWQAFHQGVVAKGNGWRFFIRASRNTNRRVSNELRRQVQVYLEKPTGGW